MSGRGVPFMRWIESVVELRWKGISAYVAIRMTGCAVEAY